MNRAAIDDLRRAALELAWGLEQMLGQEGEELRMSAEELHASLLAMTEAAFALRGRILEEAVDPYVVRAKEEYGITIGDRAGEFYSVNVVGLEAACKLTRELSAKYPKKAFQFTNTNRVDYDTSGLDDTEAELLDDAMFAGRADAKGAA